jgi:acylphosphatase
MFSRAHVIFHGKVQGVFFRANTERKAIEIGVQGWIKNNQDGSVEAIFEGVKDKINEIITFCSKKQPHAQVENVKIEWEEYQNEFDEFEIKYFD